MNIHRPTTQRHKQQCSRRERDAHFQYNHYFEYLSAKDGNIKVRCTLCAGGDKVLSSYKNTTSNLKKHLESQHCTVKLIVPVVNRLVHFMRLQATPALHEFKRTYFYVEAAGVLSAAAEYN